MASDKIWVRGTYIPLGEHITMIWYFQSRKGDKWVFEESPMRGDIINWGCYKNGFWVSSNAKIGRQNTGESIGMTKSRYFKLERLWLWFCAFRTWRIKDNIRLWYWFWHLFIHLRHAQRHNQTQSYGYRHKTLHLPLRRHRLVYRICCFL